MIYGIGFIALLIITTSINFKYQKTSMKNLTEEKKQIVIELIANQAICEPEIIDENTRFEQDLTMSDLDRLDLFMRVESEFNIHISDHDLELCSTAGQLFNLVAERL